MINRNPRRPSLISPRRALALALSAVALVGCGRTGFDPAATRLSVKSPGYFNTAPKVDLLMAVDDTGGMSEAYGAIQRQMPSFLNELQGSGWDFHFATTPLDTERELGQIAASTHDTNWGSAWTPPYPGADRNTLPGMLPAWLFRTASNYTDYVIGTRRTGSKERGFETLINTLELRTPGTNFLRQDSMLAILVVGVGEDTSRVNTCAEPGTGRIVPCDRFLTTPGRQCSVLPDNVDGGYFVAIDQACASGGVSLDHYEAEFRALRSAAGTVRFYSAVAPTQGSSCQGASTFAGKRYQAMARRLGGAAFDICTQSIPAMLGNLKRELENQRQAFEMAYLFLEREPDPATIELKVFRAESPTTPEIIPQDPANGWSYEGFLENVYAIDYPTQLNLSTGFALRLNGAGRIRGDDRVEITFTARGLRPATSR